MNERIKEFAEQAGFAVYGWNENEFKKFAELIVQECVGCVRGAGLADDVAVRNGLGFNDGISEAVTHIKQHFGVEE